MAKRPRFRTDMAISADVELTCWDGETPEGMRPEIIQIGLVEVDFENLALGREGRFYVRPRHGEVSPYCTAITGIAPETLRRQGRPFDEVMRTIAKDWGGGRKSLLCWGTDWHAIDDECRAAGCGNPFPAEGFLNVGQMFTLMLGSKTRLGLYAAMEAAGLAPTGSRHDGLDDARNAALLVLHHAGRLRGLAPGPADETQSPFRPA